MSAQTPTANNSITHAAAGNLAFLLSVIRSGETLSAGEEANVRKIVDQLEAKIPLTVLNEVGQELAQARATHAPMNGHHEGYAVMLEEMDELWEVCKRNTHSFERLVPDWAVGVEPSDKETLRRLKRAAMRKEALQIAAMAVRFIEDVCDKPST